MAKVMNEHIYIIPIGQIDKNIIKNIKNKLPGNMPISANAAVEQQKEMPQIAYDPSRRQYNAEIVLYEISKRVGIDTTAERALIITDADLYTRDSDFVLGLADAKKGICIVSTARLKNEFYGVKPDDKLLSERVLKEAAYEFGVSRGLGNCPDSRCVMYFSDNLAGIDKKRNTFCRECRDKLRRYYIAPLFKAAIKPLI